MSARAALVEVVVYLSIVLAVDHACRLYQRRRNAARELEARRSADKARHPATQHPALRDAYLRGATTAIATPEALDFIERFANGEVSA